MEQTPKTSFIPKQAIGVAKSRERRSFNVVTFVSMVLFLAVLTLSVAVFFYKEHTASKLEEQSLELTKFKEKFNSSASQDMREIRMFADRLIIAEQLLNRHLSISRLFDALEKSVQSNAQLISFTYERQPSGDAQVSLTGRALSFNTVALQESGFNTQPSFAKGTVVFSDVDTATVGTDENVVETVEFTVNADIDTSAIAYQGVSTQVDGLATTTESDTDLENEQEKDETSTSTEEMIEDSTN